MRLFSISANKAALAFTFYWYYLVFTCLTLFVISNYAHSAENASPINLPTVLKLASADNLDVKLAQEKITEAKANHVNAISKFLPWISVGVTYRQHEGLLQSADGTLIDAKKKSTTTGPTLTAQIDLGDAWFSTLAAKQAVVAAEAAHSAQQQDSAFAAVNAYFDLLKDSQLVLANQDALEISQSYEKQLQAGVTAGIIFKGDWLRAQTQSKRCQSALLLSQQQQRIASARLADLLHLDPSTDLFPDPTELAPITLVNEKDIEQLVSRALENRAEVTQGEAMLSAARDLKNNSIYGALIPSVSAQAFVGNLSGNRDGFTSSSGSSRDYTLGVNWRIGPGGLLDFSRTKAANSRLNSAEINLEKINSSIRRQVIEAHAKIQSSEEQLIASRTGVQTAKEALSLTRERKQLGVGAVLEDIQAQQELVRARTEYITALTEHNKAQYELNKALGDIK